VRKSAAVSIGAAAVLVAAGLSPAVASARTTESGQATGALSVASSASPAITWATCTNGNLAKAGAECAMISVPLDYSRPAGKKIKLAVSRVLHTVPASQYQGVMLVNPGGPGGSGLGLSVLGRYVPKKAGNAYDWIGFDPRGVGSSLPAISCDPNYFGFNRPSYVPTSNAILRKWWAKTTNYSKACAAKNGALLSHLTTVDSARDMDSIRKALGANKINYYGFSYGTYLGQVYATMFPTHLRRSVLDSNVDPRGVWYQSNLDQNIAFEKTENAWFAWLAKYDSVYHLGKTQPAVRKLFFAIEAKLIRHPAGGKIGGSEWTDAFLNAGYYQSTWIDLGNVFTNYVHKNNVADLISAYTNAQGVGDDNGYAVYLAVQCTDAAWPHSRAKYLSDNWKVYQKAPFETWSNAWYNAPCLSWPAPAHKPIKVSGKHAPSMLLIDETLDAATPYSGSLQVRKLFPHSSLIALPGGTSHANSLNGNACLDNQIADYLLTGKLPKRKAGNQADALCKPLPIPNPTVA
jgi:pimeloyl-ACP methyl ester carboxylesterase